MHGILMSHLGWYAKLLLGIVRYTSKTDMQDCWSFTCSLSWALGSLTKCSLFCRYYFGKCSYKLAQLVLLPFSQGRSTCYSDWLHDCSATIPRFHKDVYVNSFFPCKARFWNSLPIECFSLTYDLNGFKFRINRHLITVCCFLDALIFLCFYLFLVTQCLVVVVQPWMDWMPIKIFFPFLNRFTVFWCSLQVKINFSKRWNKK